MKKLTIYDNEKFADNFYKLAVKENSKSSVSEVLLTVCSEIFNESSGKKLEDKIKIGGKAIILPFAFLGAVTTSSIENNIKRHKMASVLDVSTNQVVCSEAELIEKEDYNQIFGYAGSLTYKANIHVERLKSIRYILNDAHFEALSTADLSYLENLIGVGGNLYLPSSIFESQKPIEEVLPNLKYVGGAIVKHKERIR